MKATFKCFIVDGEKSVTHFHLSRCYMDCDSRPVTVHVAVVKVCTHIYRV